MLKFSIISNFYLIFQDNKVKKKAVGGIPAAFNNVGKYID